MRSPEKIWNVAEFDLSWSLVTSIMTLAKYLLKRSRNELPRAFEIISAYRYNL